MLKFAVVHAPVGPMMDEGLYEPDHVSGIEEAHMFTGPERAEYVVPYGGNGKERFDQQDITPVKPESTRDKSRIIVVKKPTRRAKVAIDFDGTITSGPREFRDVIARATRAGHECHLVTGRPESARAGVLEYCEMYGLRFASSSFYPVEYKYEQVGWDATMDVRIGAWKAKRMAELGIGIAVDDNLSHIGQIIRHAPGIVILKPVGE